MFGFQFLVTLYFQQVLGYSPAQAGLAVLPVAIGIGAMSLVVFPRIERRFGARAALLPGLLAIAAGLALLARVPVDGRYLADVAPSVALFAVGAGLVLPGVMTIAMSGATPSTAGLASGLINTSQQVGGALGLAILAALAAGRTDGLRDEGVGAAAATVAGFHLAWGVAAGLVLAAFAVALGLGGPRRRRPRPPRRAPGQHDERRDEHGAHEERVDEDAEGHEQRELAERQQRHERQQRERRGERHAGHRDGAGRRARARRRPRPGSSGDAPRRGCAPR